MHSTKKFKFYFNIEKCKPFVLIGRLPNQPKMGKGSQNTIAVMEEAQRGANLLQHETSSTSSSHKSTVSQTFHTREQVSSILLIKAQYAFIKKKISG